MMIMSLVHSMVIKVPMQLAVRCLGGICCCYSFFVPFGVSGIGIFIFPSFFVLFFGKHLRASMASSEVEREAIASLICIFWSFGLRNTNTVHDDLFLDSIQQY